jgi:CheY-like chemotaxis protein
MINPKAQPKAEPYDPLRMRAGDTRILVVEMKVSESAGGRSESFDASAFLPCAIPVEMSCRQSGGSQGPSRAWLVACDSDRLLLAHGVFVREGTPCDLLIVCPDGERVSVEGAVTAVAHVRGRLHRIAVTTTSDEGTALLHIIAAARDRITGRIGDAAECSSPRLRGRVLLAEDTPDTQGLFSHFLKRAGAEVSVAGNGLIALRMIQTAEREGRPYGLLLTDIQMPELDGLALMQIVRKSNQSLPIVAVTALTSEEDRRRCLASGCNEYAAKPINRPDLVALCSRWVAA